MTDTVDSEDAADDGADEPPAPERVSRGVMALDCDMRIGGIAFRIGPDNPEDEPLPPPTFELRTDMWHYWLREAIDAAIAAHEAGTEIPPLREKFEAGEATNEELGALAERELIATMRAIGACAFAIDAFYAAVKARSGPHPDEATWRQKRTARHKQVTETLFYRLKINNQATKTQIREWVSKIYDFRDKAVHPASEFRPPFYRSDLNAALDQVFSFFAHRNALLATGMAVCTLDYCVAFLDNGGAELAEQKPGARRRMDAVLDRYESAGVFFEVVRREPPSLAESESEGTES